MRISNYYLMVEMTHKVKVCPVMVTRHVGFQPSHTQLNPIMQRSSGTTYRPLWDTCVWEDSYCLQSGCVCSPPLTHLRSFSSCKTSLRLFRTEHHRPVQPGWQPLLSPPVLSSDWHLRMERGLCSGWGC